MTDVQTNQPTRPKPLRLWPGVVIVVLQWLAWQGVPLVRSDAGMFPAIGVFVGGLAFVVWWAFLSRAPRDERWGAIVLMIVALVATRRILHESMATAGMGVLFFFYAIPALSLAFVIWAVASRRLAGGLRRTAMVATILVACGGWALVRTAGVSSTGSEFTWRWTETPEERLLAQANNDPDPLPPAPATADVAEERVAAPAGVDLETPPPTFPTIPAAPETRAEWTGFRGPERDSVIPGVQIETDWSASPPVELWRRPIGPGWSSFAVRGNLLYTQEQRGDDEVVSCHDVTTGEPVWRHRDATRFWESNGGAGPRATPTLADGRLYTFGATGILNALDADTGAVLWSRNAASDTGEEVPIWGFTSSPLVVDDLVIVHAGTLVAYDLATGDPRWFGPDRGGSYSSPHLATIDGVAQILMLSGAGATSVAATDGTLLWENEWPSAPIVQPALTADGDVLIAAGGMTGGLGLRRLAVAHRSGGWTVGERWTSRGLKPWFNDFVVHEGHAFGFDGTILAAIDVEGGERRWKGGRYGNGQLVLLADQDVLLVLSDQGELALVAAAPDRFTELARFPALEGKTWNHPVLVGDVLLVRNGQEMVAFRLPVRGG
jgi:outer membrane protein assembly factor BamB